MKIINKYHLIQKEKKLQFLSKIISYRKYIFTKGGVENRLLYYEK